MRLRCANSSWHRQQSGWHRQRRPSRQPAPLPCSVGPRSRTACAADRNRGSGHAYSWRRSSGPAPRHRGQADRTSGKRGSDALPRTTAVRSECRRYRTKRTALPTSAQSRSRKKPMPNAKRMTKLFRRSSLPLVAALSLSLAACQTTQDPPPEVARDLPAKPDRLMTSPAPPALDRTCPFPWFGVAGCRGKDPSAMLRLTVSHDQEQAPRLDGPAAWCEGVRDDY